MRPGFYRINLFFGCGYFDHGIALGDCVDHIHAVGHFSKNGVFSIQVGLRGMGDEKLAAIGVWTGISHGDHPGFVLKRVAINLVRKFITGATAARAGGVSTLDDEIIDYPVETNPVVVAILGQEDKIVNRDGCVFGIEFQFDITLVRFHGDEIGFPNVDLHCGWIVPLFLWHKDFLSVGKVFSQHYNRKTRSLPSGRRRENAYVVLSLKHRSLELVVIDGRVLWREAFGPEERLDLCGD